MRCKMTVGTEVVEFLTSMASCSVEELEAQVAALEEVKETTEAESLRRKGLINKIQHQRVTQSESVGETLEERREAVATLQRLLSRSLTVSKTALAFLDQATLQQGQLSPAILERLTKLDIAHEHVISSFAERSAAYAIAAKNTSAPAPTPAPAHALDRAVDVVGSIPGRDQREIAAMATPPIDETTRESRIERETREPMGSTTTSQGAILSFRPSAVYGAAPAPGDALPSPSPPAVSSTIAGPPQRRQLPSHISIITPEATDAGARPMAMSAAAGTATVGGAVGVISGLKLRPTSEFQPSS